MLTIYHYVLFLSLMLTFSFISLHIFKGTSGLSGLPFLEVRAQNSKNCNTYCNIDPKIRFIYRSKTDPNSRHVPAPLCTGVPQGLRYGYRCSISGLFFLEVGTQTGWWETVFIAGIVLL